MCEHGRRASHIERYDGPNIRPKQLPNGEVRWEGTPPFLYPRGASCSRELRKGRGRCSVPEINGPVVQSRLAGFTFLLRETCGSAPPDTAGTEVSNGHRGTAGV